MSLIYFHRFLISCAILFSLFFAWNFFNGWRRAQHPGDLVVSVLAVGTALGLGFYLRTVRMPRRPDQKHRPS